MGQRVVCLTVGGWGRRCDVPANACFAIPDDYDKISDADAVTVNLAYCTAYLGLVELAKIQEGERVLVHSAAGGVGLASMHLCK